VPQRDEWLDEKDRRESLSSLYYFGKFVLGYDLEKQPHLEVCDFIQDMVMEKGMLLLPRGSFKTTIVSQILPVWLALKNQNTRILLYSEVLKNSVRNLEVVKNLFTQNMRLRQLFGTLVGKDDGNQYSLTINTRKNYRLKEPTFGTASLETVDVGPHYDWILVDDLHSEKNTQNRDQIDGVYHSWRLLFSLLDPGAHMRILGTRWNEGDVYGRIKEDHKNIKVLEYPAILPDGSEFFPARLDHKTLAAIREEQGTEIYFSQYMNDPMPKGENQAFLLTNFRYGQHQDCPLVMAVDPAIGMGERADNTAIVVAGLASSTNKEGVVSLNELFVEHYEAKRMAPDDTINSMFVLLDRYGPRIRTIAIEDVAFQRMLRFAFEKEMRKRGKHYNIIGLKHTQKKEDRILSLQPMYACKAVYHKAWMKGGMLEDELVRFPKGKHDDVIDALAGCLEVLQPHSRGHLKTMAARVKEITAKERLKKMKHESDRNLDGRIAYHLELARTQTGWNRRVPHQQLGEI